MPTRLGIDVWIGVAPMVDRSHENRSNLFVLHGLQELDDVAELLEIDGWTIVRIRIARKNEGNGTYAAKRPEKPLQMPRVEFPRRAFDIFHDQDEPRVQHFENRCEAL